jgi:hypothetical protein
MLAKCLSETDRSSLWRKPLAHFTTMLVETGMGCDVVKVVHVQVFGVDYWTDRTTGSLYDYVDGHCLSSTNLRLLLDTEGKSVKQLRHDHPNLQIVRETATNNPGGSPEKKRKDLY